MIVIIIGIIVLSIYINHLMYIDKRFQESNKVEQWFRYRHYLYIPFLWLWNSIKGIKVRSDENDEVYTGKGVLLWRLLIGTQQYKMKWYYTTEEVFRRIDNLK